MSIPGEYSPKQSVEDFNPSKSDSPSHESSKTPDEPTERSSQPPKVPKKPGHVTLPASSSPDLLQTVSNAPPSRQPPLVPRRPASPHTDAPPSRRPPSLPRKPKAPIFKDRIDESEDLVIKTIGNRIHVIRTTKDQSKETSPYLNTSETNTSTNAIVKDDATDPPSGPNLPKDIEPRTSLAESSATRADQSPIINPLRRQKARRPKSLSSSSSSEDSFTMSKATDSPPPPQRRSSHGDDPADSIYPTPNSERLASLKPRSMVDLSALSNEQESNAQKSAETSSEAQESHFSRGRPSKVGIHRKARRKVLQEPVLAVLLGRAQAREARENLVLASPTAKERRSLSDTSQSSRGSSIGSSHGSSRESPRG